MSDKMVWFAEILILRIGCNGIAKTHLANV